MIRTIARNVVSNWAGVGASVLVTFFLTPFVLADIGNVCYGLWVLTISITGSYGVLAFGLQGAINQYLARHLANRDFGQMNVFASTATFVLSFVAVAILAIALGIAWLAPVIFNIPEGLEREAFWCILIVGSSFALQLRFFVFSASLIAAQRFDISNIVGVSTRLLYAALVVGALKSGWGIVGLAIADATTVAVDCLIRWRVAYRTIPHLKVAYSLVSKAAFRGMLPYSSWSLLVAVAQSTFYYSDSIVISSFLPIAGLAYYSLAAGLARNLEMVLSPFTHVFFPAATQLHAQNQTARLTKVYTRASRLYLVIVAVASVFAGFWAKDFYRLWVGENFISGAEFPSVANLFLVLLAAMCGRLFPGIGIEVLSASLRVRPLAILALAEASANVLLSIGLSRYFGLMGVAVGTLISTVVFRTFAIPWLLSRQLEVGLCLYFTSCAVRPLLVGFSLSVVAWIIRSLTLATSFIALTAHGTLFLSAALPLVVFLGLTGDDRQQLVYSPLHAIWIRLRGQRYSTAIVESRCKTESSGAEITP